MKSKKTKTKLDFSDQTTEEILNGLKSAIQSTNQLEHGKTISISELPQCHHKNVLVSIVHNPVTSKICIVAVKQPDNKSWQAYAGYPDIGETKGSMIDYGDLIAYDWVWLCENVHDVEQVRFMGELLPQEIAIELFPDWKELEYR